MMTDADEQEPLLRTILPYSYVVGQEKLKLALELAYIVPRIGGVLISGKRGTAKSTIARAFARMMYGRLPVTIPINATEDRVVGGWDVKGMLNENTMREQPGLLEEAHQGLLYVDEVNLLDDHIVNIILDVLSTGKLSIQREGRNDPREISTLFVGTMNPEEGSLRPQLQDRFGLMVQVEADTDPDKRLKILHTVLEFDRALQEVQEEKSSANFIKSGHEADERRKTELENAKRLFYKVKLLPSTARACVELAQACEIEGHRGDYLLALAACAYAALHNEPEAIPEHLQAVAELVLRHRLPGALQLSNAVWGEEEEQRVNKILGYA